MRVSVRASVQGTRATPSPEAQVCVPDSTGANRLFPYCPLALVAAVPLTNSISLTGFTFAGPSPRYIEPYSMIFSSRSRSNGQPSLHAALIAAADKIAARTLVLKCDGPGCWDRFRGGIS